MVPIGSMYQLWPDSQPICDANRKILDGFIVVLLP
jgi:hypothetical protein